MGKPTLRLIHTDAVYASGPGKLSLNYWRTRSTKDIEDTLRPGQPEALRVKPDGRMINGNTRLKVLLERGKYIDQLPREELP